MCGIGGYYNLSKTNFVADKGLLEAMQQSIAHRGPNGYKVWTSPCGQLGLVHRRLSIMDLSDSGTQPMFDAEQTVAVCCNGEIYNYRVLKKELEALGHTFRSQCDTEVIVYAYKQWGITCLEKFEGMFAIVIADLVRNELYLVRDRIGIKPLYFSVQGGILSFASEIKALWHLPWNKRTVSPQALYHYLTFLATPAPMTLYDKVYKLPAAFYAKVDAHKQLSFVEWYNPLVPKETINTEALKNEEACIQYLQALIAEAVEKRLMSDVPFGAFLSGGVDSSLIVAHMAQMTNNVKTFNISFEDGPEYSEVDWARKVARRFGTDHREIVIAEKQAFQFFEQMVYHQDEPLADCVCIPLYYVAKLLKDAGVTVALVGEGSDEQFCGYATYARYIDTYHRYWKNSQRFIPAFAKKGAYRLARNFFPTRTHELDILHDWAEHRSLFWSGATAFAERSKKQYFKHTKRLLDDNIFSAIYPELKQVFDSYAIVEHHLDQYKKRSAHHDFLMSMTYLELKQRLPELLLMRVDKMTMATSVEARVPFLDHKLVEFAFHIPSEWKYKQGVTKYILKRAAENLLPRDIIYRKKMGFAAPTMRWFKEGIYFKHYFQDMLATKKNEWNEFVCVDEVQKLLVKNQESKHDYSLKLWTLQNLIASNISSAL